MTIKLNKWIVLVCILSYIGTLAIMPQLPQTIINHWGADGVANGYADKSMYYWLGALPLIIYISMIIFPKIDPRRQNYALHEKAYKIFQIGITFFMVAVTWVSVAINLGINIPISFIIPFGLGILFILMGNYMPQIRHNYFFGIKTPWTLADETVWKKTHRLGGYLFMISGVVTLLSAFFQSALFIIAMTVTLLLTVAVTFVYSYLEYKKIH